MGSWIRFPFRTTVSTTKEASAVDFSKKALKEEDSELGSTKFGGSCGEEKREKHVSRGCIVKAVRQKQLQLSLHIAQVYIHEAKCRCSRTHRGALDLNFT